MIAQDILDFKAGMEAEGDECGQYRLKGAEAGQLLTELAETQPKKKAKALLDIVKKGDAIKFINTERFVLFGVRLRAVPDGV